MSIFGRRLTIINPDEIYTAFNTFFHSFPASALTPSSRLVKLWKRVTIARKKTNVATCVESPAINVFVPMVRVVPAQLCELAIPVPETCIKKDIMSQMTNMRVSLATGIL
jgi:hypothetical protein